MHARPCFGPRGLRCLLVVPLLLLIAVGNSEPALDDGNLFCEDDGSDFTSTSSSSAPANGPRWSDPPPPVLPDSTTEFDHVVHVANSEELSAALGQLANSTRILLAAGTYTLPGNELAPGAFWLENVREVTIEGQCSLEDQNGNCVAAGSVLDCSEEHVGENRGRGLAVVNSSNIVLANVSVHMCGALHWSTSWSGTTGQLPILVALMFVRCANVTFHGLQVSRSLGAGAFLADVYGEVHVSACSFSENNATLMTPYLNTQTNATSHVFGGGGLLLEFPYCSIPVMMDARNATAAVFRPECNSELHNDWVHAQPQPKYTIVNNTFTANRGVSYNHENFTFIRPGGRFHQAFGRGGGLSMYFKGVVHHSQFTISQCRFIDNLASWGAGLFLELQDDAVDHNVSLSFCHFERNIGEEAGGGVRIGFIFLTGNSSHDHNAVEFFSTDFLENSADWGGGISAYTATEPRLLPTNSLELTSCRWWRNSAVNGAAVALSRWHFVVPGALVIPVFTDCTFRENFIIPRSIVGRAAVLVDTLSLSFRGRNNFCLNNGSALVLDSSSADVDGQFIFVNNSGVTGGAVMMTGFSWITLQSNAYLLFEMNHAQMNGGALYSETSSAHSVLSSRNCFLQYYDQTTSPDDWTATLTFDSNYASAAGNSIYATTLYHCLWGSNTQGAYPSDKQLQRAMNWSSFHYFPGSHSGYQIATTANRLQGPIGTVRLAPGQHRKLMIDAMDDLNQTAETIVFAGLSSEEDNTSELALGNDQYHTISEDQMSAVWLLGMPNETGTLNLRTLSSRPVTTSIEMGTDYCYACYKYSPKDNKCECLTDLTEGASTAVSRCNSVTYGCYLQNGYWGGFVVTRKHDLTSPMEFVTAPCPFDYCECDHSNGATFSECALNHTVETETSDSWGIYLNAQCMEHRGGRLCGKCLNGTSVMMGSSRCAYCEEEWVGPIWGVLAMLGIIVTIIMIRLDFNVLSGHVSSAWFFFQVLPYILSDNASYRFTIIPPFNVITSLVNAALPFSTCFYKGMDDLNKLGLAYAVPAYILLAVIVVAYVSRFPRVQRILLCGCDQENLPSVLKTLCSLLVIFYVSLVANSFELLAFTYIGNTGPWLVRDANIKLWGPRHAPWGFFAVLVILLVAVPVPIFLLFGPCLQRRYSMTRFKPLLDIVQAPYAPNRRSFAGFYFVARLVILIITSTEIISLAVRQVTLQLMCLFLVVIHMLGWPYGGRFVWLNYIDSIILASLAATTQVNFFYGIRSDSGETTNWAKPVVIVFMSIPLVYLTVFCISWVIVHLVRKANEAGLIKGKVPTFYEIEQSLSTSTVSIPVRRQLESSYEDSDAASILWAATSGRDTRGPSFGRGPGTINERNSLINSDPISDDDGDDDTDALLSHSYGSFDNHGNVQERNTNSSHGYESSSTNASNVSVRSLDHQAYDSNSSMQRRRDDSGRGSFHNQHS